MNPAAQTCEPESQSMTSFVKSLSQQLGSAFADANWSGIDALQDELTRVPAPVGQVIAQMVEAVDCVLDCATRYGVGRVPRPSVTELQAGLETFEAEEELGDAIRPLCDQFARSLVHPRVTWSTGRREESDDSLEKFQHDVLFRREVWLRAGRGDSELTVLTLQILGQVALTAAIDLEQGHAEWINFAVKSWFANSSAQLGQSVSTSLQSKSVAGHGIVNGDGLLPL